MHIDGVPNRGSRPTDLLRESYREGRKVQMNTVPNPAQQRALQLLQAITVRPHRRHREMPQLHDPARNIHREL